jgi:hypothetical protein
VTSFYFFIAALPIGWLLGFIHGIDFERHQGRYRR